ASGYRWIGGGHGWWCDVLEKTVDEEFAWLCSEAYLGKATPSDLPRFRIDAWSRWSRRVPEARPR
ncbi:MAG TPA: hypothetical protein VLN74_11785, partial [Ilumatobacteraceae bacterium]|nr:hypothetical protein [Ilumatobacteraceae bacterium]